MLPPDWQKIKLEVLLSHISTGLLARDLDRRIDGGAEEAGVDADEALRRIGDEE